jgi:D-serine deaminase-like pyridoxal phosphate-dependent protein
MEWPELPADHPTPSLIVDASRVRRNLDRMQAYCHAHGLRLRPHTKTHKSQNMARLQLDAGAIGLTVAKVGEAECMSQVCSDIFIAYPAVGGARLERLGELARSHRITVGVDSLVAAEGVRDAARRFATRIGILVDLDVGFHRTGISDPNEAIRLCEWIAQQKDLYFAGVMCFPGHILPTANEEIWQAYQASVQNVLDGLQKRSIEAPTISGGSTPTALQSHRNSLLNEIRPGTYIYNDWNEVRLGVATLDDCAARVLATIVSTPSRNRFVVDAGSKTLSSDRNAAEPDSGFGHVVEYPEAKIIRLSEEHGEVVLPESYVGRPPTVGQTVWIIPNHICVCVNLQNAFYLVDGGNAIELNVDARGLLV